MFRVFIHYIFYLYTSYDAILQIYLMTKLLSIYQLLTDIILCYNMTENRAIPRHNVQFLKVELITAIMYIGKSPRVAVCKMHAYMPGDRCNMMNRLAV